MCLRFYFLTVRDELDGMGWDGTGREGKGWISDWEHEYEYGSWRPPTGNLKMERARKETERKGKEREFMKWTGNHDMAFKENRDLMTWSWMCVCVFYIHKSYSMQIYI